MVGIVVSGIEGPLIPEEGVLRGGIEDVPLTVTDELQPTITESSPEVTITVAFLVPAVVYVFATCAVVSLSSSPNQRYV